LTETPEIIKSQHQTEDRPNETQTADKAGTETRGGNTRPESFTMRKRIGSTAYEAEVYFSPTGRETLDEKILRLLRSEVLNEDE
jgi:hypothetical protein